MRDGWKEYLLGDLIEIKHGYGFKGEYFVNEPNNNLLLTPGNFAIGGGFKSDKMKYYEGPIPNDFILSSGDVIVTMTDLSKQADTLGYSAKIPNDPNNVYLHNQRLGLVALKNDKCDLNFIYWLLRTSSYQRYIAGSSSGATVKHTSPAKIYSAKVQIPKSKSTQRKIASILSAYDDLIENNLKRIKLLEEKAQRTYEEWFVKMRFPGHETAVFDKVTGLPEGWEKVKLHQITDYIGRGISPKYVDIDGFTVINQKCIRDQRVDLALSRLTDVSKKIQADKILKSFDILVNSTGTGTLGRVAQILTIKDTITVDTHVTIVRANKLVSKLFLGRAIEYNQEKIENLGKGATNQIELSRNDLGELISIDLPNNQLQDLYEKIFKPNYLVIENLTIQNQRLKEARDLLLPRLMSGMIDVDKVGVANLEEI